MRPEGARERLYPHFRPVLAQPGCYQFVLSIPSIGPSLVGLLAKTKPVGRVN